jgi:hypothetical protein
VLLPKKDQAESIRDYKPIKPSAQCHKDFSKILANMLAPRLPEMVCSSQSPFVKKRCINDNFLLVQSIAKDFYMKKIPTPFLKLDITKAFDSISWAYLLEVLEKFWFRTRRRD